MNDNLYFSFGSNMDRAQMKERTPNANYIGVGYIENHDLVFNRKGSYRPGGVSSVVFCEGTNAYGVVWSISNQELQKMDEIEDPQAYERTTKTITTLDGQKLTCYVYISFPQKNMIADQKYLELIISAAKSAKLPDHWIERIKKYRVKNPQYDSA